MNTARLPMGPHGEAQLVESYGPRSVLDAGCGKGRVAIELARRGIDVVGVDIDAASIDVARANAPDLPWMVGDISQLDLGRQFDAIVMAGNVMIFLAPGTHGKTLANMARHLAPGGVLIAGFQLSMGYLELEDYDLLAEQAGLELIERFSTWEREPWDRAGHYAVSVHRHASKGSDR